MRYAPGYLSDARELDARYATEARIELAHEASESTSIWAMFGLELSKAIKGDFGVSRQFDTPVRSLLSTRLPVTAILLARSVSLAWMLSLALSLLAAMKPATGFACSLPATVLLALPTSVLATLSLLSDMGGPVLVLTLLLAARDFILLKRILRKCFADPHVLQAHAQGLRWHRILIVYVRPNALPQLGSVAGLSVITALGAIIPVEVLFGIPGIGQLAWNAAMNRDSPVLIGVTSLIAVVMTTLSRMLDGTRELRQEAV